MGGLGGGRWSGGGGWWWCGERVPRMRDGRSDGRAGHGSSSGDD